MKKYIFLFLLLSGCLSKKKNEPFTFDASKDTSFIVEDDDIHHVFLKYTIVGQLEDSTHIVVTYHNPKGNENVKLDIPLNAGKVEIKNGIWDFYDSKALFTFKHLNNKKGKLTIKASL